MKILFATDGSDSALAALEFLLRFPLPAGSEVVVATVIDQAAFPDHNISLISGVITDDRSAQAKGERDGSAPQQDQDAQLSEAERNLLREAQDHLRRVSSRLQSAGWSSSTEIHIGHPIDQICNAAETLAVDLILVGTHGLGGLRRHLLGSVSAGVLHYAQCSVLLVPHPDLAEHSLSGATAPLRFLLAYDGSEPADRAVDLCASLPLQGHASITLLRVLELVTLYRQDLGQRMSPAFRDEKRTAQEELEAAAERLRQATPEVEIKLLESDDLSRSILETAAEQHSDLILLGHKGRSAIKRMLVGSAVARVAAQTQCALLVVR